jgi:catalase
MHNPRGRVNYEPNSWGGAQGGPREVAQGGSRAVPVSYSEEKARVPCETFGDHYSQARQFYISQIAIEQKHMAKALTFELSKVKTKAIRLRMLSHLLNIHEDLAQAVAQGLAIKDLPHPLSADTALELDEMVESALSAIFDAVAILPASDAASFLATCRSLRFWEGQMAA